VPLTKAKLRPHFLAQNRSICANITDSACFTPLDLIKTLIIWLTGRKSIQGYDEYASHPARSDFGLGRRQRDALYTVLCHRAARRPDAFAVRDAKI